MNKVHTGGFYKSKPDIGKGLSQTTEQPENPKNLESESSKMQVSEMKVDEREDSDEDFGDDEVEHLEE